MAALDDFGRNIRRLRLAAGLSQMELGNRSGLALTEISRLECAAREPRLRTLMKLAYGLGIAPGELLDHLPRHRDAWG